MTSVDPTVVNYARFRVNYLFWNLETVQKKSYFDCKTLIEIMFT